MAKKSLKRGLALGALMAFVITGSALAADYTGQIIDQNVEGYQKITANIGTTIIESAGRYAAIGASTGPISVSGDDISINGEGDYSGRLYGIDATNDGTELTIKANSIIMNLTNNGTGEIRAIRNNSADLLSINGNLEADIVAHGSLAVGFDIWGDTVKFGTTKITVNSEVGRIIGIQNWNSGGASLIFKDKYEFEATNGSNYDNWYQGILAYQSTTIFDKETSLVVNDNGDSGVRVTNVECDPGNQYDTVITFNGDTNLKATSENSWIQGVYTSGVPGVTNFNGDIVNIYVKSNGSYVEAISSQYGAHVNGAANTNFDITAISANSYAKGIHIGQYAGYNGNVDLKGNVNIKTEAATDSIGIYNQALDIIKGSTNPIKSDADGKVTIGGDVVIKATSSMGEAYGVYTEGKNGITKMLGNVDITAIGVTNANAIYVCDGAQIGVGSAGKTVSLTGDVVADGGTINATGAKVDLIGAVATLNSGITNINFGSGTWNLSGASSVTSATFGAGSSLVIDGTKFTGENADYAITGKVSMDPTANLVIKNSTPNTLYKVVDGENNISDSNLSYDRTELVAVENTNGVYEVNFKTVDKASAAELTSAQNKAITAAGGSQLIAPNMVAAGIGPNAAAGSKALVGAITSSGASGSEMSQMFNDNANIGEEAGTSATATSIMNNVTGITTQRMSFTQMNTAPQGGHGKVERKYKTGAGVWAQYMHGKDKVEYMPSAGGSNSYDSQYNGAVIGYDFKEVGKTHTGISFNYGEGDSHSKKSITSTRNDFDFWGVGLYHSIMNDDTNLIFDINYNKSDADVKQIVAGHEVTANPKTSSFSVGVRAEKLIQNGPVQIVPYAGARFLTIDTDDYKSSADYWYAPERQNIWLIPVGVSLRQENVYENGWKVTPKADLSYIWALGDTDSSTTVSSGAGSNPFEYTVMDNGSFLGTLGIEAEKGDWTYGLSYSYQKGEYQRSDKWFVDVRYSF